MQNFVNYRLEYSKTGMMRYIGHIDTMKLFHKLFRMSGLPIVFSQGFNPHQIFTIAHPLSVGQEGLAELADFRLNVEVSPDVILSSLNKSAPKGLRMTRVWAIAAEEKSCAALVAAADYTVEVTVAGLREVIEQLMAQDELLAQKRTKSGTSLQDIRKDIYSLSIDEATSILGGVITMRLSAGSSANLKPQLVLQQVFERAGLLFDEHAHLITRKSLFRLKNNELANF